MTMPIPKLPKKVHSFLTKEDGKISKKKLITAGVVVATIAAASAVHAANVNMFQGSCDSVQAENHAGQVTGSAHENSVSLTQTNGEIVGTHNHCIESHGSHNSGCCFPAGTKIATSKGFLLIENIKVGAGVLSYNLSTRKVEESIVQELESPIREGVYDLNKGALLVTNDHPFYTKKRDGNVGWAAIDNTAAKKSYDLKEILRLEVGDSIYCMNDKWKAVTSLSYRPGRIQTYHLRRVTINNNFFAEGFLVHNKKMC